MVGALNEDPGGREIILDAVSTAQVRDDEELQKFKHWLNTCSCEGIGFNFLGLILLHLYFFRTQPASPIDTF